MSGNKYANFFREFIRLESSAGIILFFAAIFALIIANSPLAYWYHTFFNLPFTLKLDNLKVEKPLLLWINEGFMAVFFLLIGLEIKREMLEGELDNFKKSLLPLVAALGGMIIPALIYVFFNYKDEVALQGWAIPCATDTAFSLGLLAVLGKRIPQSLKIFLTAVAIFDDIGAIIVIAVFYTAEISLILLLVAGLILALLLILNRLKVTALAPYIILGVFLWLCVLKSGVHATLAGFALALAVPLKSAKKQVSPLRDLERALHPWVAFGILPLFAFANAGFSFQGFTMAMLLNGITLGIALGLFLGKQIGIWGFSMFAIKCGVAEVPAGATRLGIYGIALVAGIGFTMSLFIGGLAFGASELHEVQLKVGVMVGSLLSGIAGYLVLQRVYKVD